VSIFLLNKAKSNVLFSPYYTLFHITNYFIYPYHAWVQELYQLTFQTCVFLSPK